MVEAEPCLQFLIDARRRTANHTHKCNSMSAYEEIGLRNVNGRATGHHSGLDFAGAFAFLAETEVLLILVSVLCIDVRSVSVACFVSVLGSLSGTVLMGEPPRSLFITRIIFAVIESLIEQNTMSMFIATSFLSFSGMP